MNKPTHKDVSRRGGQVGGKARGDCKRRSAEHYARISRLGVEARRAKREEREGDPTPTAARPGDPPPGASPA